MELAVEEASAADGDAEEAAYYYGVGVDEEP